MSERGEWPPWWSWWFKDGDRAARLRRGAKGMPEGSVRTVGEAVTAVFTACKWAIGVLDVEDGVEEGKRRPD